METVKNILIALLGFAVLSVFYILFPYWASKQAQRRGMETMRIIALGSIFVLLGPLGGLIAYLVSAGKAPIGEFQEQCPKCGSDKVTAKLMALDKTSGTELKPAHMIWLEFGLYLLFSLFAFFFAWGLFDESIEWFGFTGIFPAVVMVILGVLNIVQAIGRTQAYFAADKDKLIKHHCNECGNDWDVVEGKSEANLI